MLKINYRYLSGVLLVFSLVMPILSCSGGVKNTAVTPDPTSNPQYMADQNGSSHNLWMYSEVYIDPASMTYEVIPVRNTTGHWNVLKWLETSPCTDCLKLTGIAPSGNGTLLVDVQIKHPFPNARFTGFDVRGIAIFPGSLEFPVSGLITQDPSSGDGYLANAEGYTSLYNPTTLGSGPGGLQGYMKGKLATPTAPNATVNGFLRYSSIDPANTRNAFYAGDTITRQFEIKLPGAPFMLGYAVDASWAPPTVNPVIDPMTDFPPEANAPEPWEIETSIDPILNSGQTVLFIDVYDRDGKDTHQAPVVECPDLFDGTITAIWISDESGYTHYMCVFSNTKYAPEGIYRCLVSVEANENNPIDTPWLDLTAYEVVDVTVIASHGELIWAENGGGTLSDSGNGVGVLSDDSFIVTGTFYGSMTFGAGQPNETVLTGAGLSDRSDVFVARYDADGILAWAKRAGGVEHDYGLSVGILSDDSAIISGAFSASAIFGEGEANETELTSDGLFDMFIARYNPDGTLEWAKRAGGTAWDFGNKITVLPSGDKFGVTGYFNNTAVFGPGEAAETSLVSAAADDIFVAKYLPNGDLIWAKRAGGIGADAGFAVGTLSEGSFMVAGDFSQSATFGLGEPNETTLTSEGSNDIFIARFNSSGALTWAKRAGGGFADNIYDMTVLPDDTYIMSGSFAGTAVFGAGELNETTLHSASGGPDKDLVVARYNPDGTCVWATRAGAIGNEIGNDVVKLAANGVVVTGQFMGDSIFGLGELHETTLNCASFLSGPDIFVARYNLDGTLAWAKSAGGTGYDFGFAIDVLNDDTTVATGEFENSCTFGSGELNETVLTSTGEYDMFIARFYP